MTTQQLTRRRSAELLHCLRRGDVWWNTQYWCDVVHAGLFCRSNLTAVDASIIHSDLILVVLKMLCLYANTCGSIHWRQSQSMPQKWEDETVSVVVHIWHCFQEVPWVKLLASRKKKLEASIRELWQWEPERRDATFLVWVPQWRRWSLGGLVGSSPI